MATIAQNLAALQQARTDIAEAIENKGVSLEEGAGFTDFPSAIEDIPTGVDTSNDTVTSATLAEGVTAHDAAGEQITGTMQGGLEMNVKFTAGNKTIPQYMFYNNHGSGSTSKSYPIEEVVIGDGVTSIGERAFNGCSGLTSVTIPNSVTSIDGYAFEGTIVYDSNIVNNMRYIDDWAIMVTDTSITSFSYKPNTRGLAARAFINCINLTSITIPNDFTKLGKTTFYNCKSLTSINIPNNITIIDSGVFQFCSDLIDITIPNSVTSIGDSAFSNCKSLTNIDLPDSIISIGRYAFAYCNNLLNITIPNSITRIEYMTFQNCKALTSISVPNSVVFINSDAFYGCTAVTRITVNKPSGSISGAPWGATNATVVWTG